MLIVGQRIKLSDGIYRVKEVDSFKAKVVQEETEVREFTTRFDKKVKIKSKPKVRYISPNAELKILKDIPLKEAPKQKTKPVKIKTKRAVKAKPAPSIKVKSVVVKKAAKPAVKPKPVNANKTTSSVKKSKQAAEPAALKKKSGKVPEQKITKPVVKPEQISGQKVTARKKKPKPDKDKYEQLNLF